jgi:DNA-binding transcriptional ArsR family regulator
MPVELSDGTEKLMKVLFRNRTKDPTMPSNPPQIAEVAHLIGDPARANILASLMDGRSLTARELAAVAHVTPQTTSSHLAKLVRRELLVVEKQGRHRYYRLATPLIAQMMEGIMAVAAIEPPTFRPSRRLDNDMRRARTCYDHLAGQLGVALFDSLVERGFVVMGADAGALTDQAVAFFNSVGIDLAASARTRRAFCRPCLDWSERRPHLAGRLGAALLDLFFQKNWVRRRQRTRAVEITPVGGKAFRDLFNVQV